MNDIALKQPPEPEVFTFNLRHYWRVLMRHKWNIAALTAIVVVVTGLVVSLMQPVYRTSATVLVESQQVKVLSLEGVYNVTTSNKEYFLTQFELLKSRELAEQVVRRLELEKHPLFDPAQRQEGFNVKALFSPSVKVSLTDEQRFAGAVDKFIAGLVITPVRNTQLVKVSYQSTDPVLAASIANTLADLYIDSHMEAKLAYARNAKDWLAQRLVTLRADMAASERRVQTFADTGVIADKPLTKQELQQRYEDAKNNRINTEVVYQQVQQLGPKPDPEELLELTAIQNLPSVQKLNDLKLATESTLAGLSAELAIDSPQVLVAKADVGKAIADLHDEVDRIAKMIGKDYQWAINAEKILQAKVAAADGRLVDPVAIKQATLQELQREADERRQIYQTFLRQARTTDEAGCLQSAQARVSDPALVPRAPVAPKKGVAILLALIAGLISSIVLALLLEAINNTIRDPDDVEEKLANTMLGFLPAVKSHKGTAVYDGFITDSKSNFAEAIRSLRSSLIFTATEKPRKVSVITSSVSGEGVSTVALNLAAALAQQEKVLLIDANMRTQVMEPVLGLPSPVPGLSELITGTAVVNDCVRKLGNTTADVLTTGAVPDDPLQLLSSPRFAALLLELRNHYDRIIVDSAPIDLASDAMLLSSLADTLIYVVKADATAAPLAVRGIKRLQSTGVAVAGVVLNYVDCGGRV